MFRDGVLQRRAIIPARWFYEWNRAREKITFFQEKEKILYLAGFFNWYQDGPHFVILTTEANESMKKTHDRMPLIFTEEEARTWLDGQGGERMEHLLKKRPAALQKKAEYEQISFF